MQPSDEDIVMVAEFAGFPNAAKKEMEWVWSSRPLLWTLELHPFWSSLDAWQTHIWPRLMRTDENFQEDFADALETPGQERLEFAHIDAATRTIALARVLGAGKGGQGT